MMSFELSIGQKMLRFRKVTLENLKNRETFRYLSTFKFSKVICNEFWLEAKLIRNKNLFVKGFIIKKPKGGRKNGISNILKLFCGER